MKRLGLVLDQIIFENQGRYSTDEVFIKFVEGVGTSLSDRIQFCSRVQKVDEDAPYGLDSSIYDIIRFPWYRDVAELSLKSPRILPVMARILRGEMPTWGLAIAFGVHPLTPLVIRMARRRRLPALLWIRGDLIADLNHRIAGIRRTAALAVARTVIRAIPNGTPVVSIGRDDYPFLSRMGPVHVAYSSKFGAEDFSPGPRPQSILRSNPRLLYVGRVAPEKGVEVLLEAFRLLRSRHSDSAPILTLVGSDFYTGSYGAAFSARLQNSDLVGAVEMAGHVPYGNRLFEFYDTHDLLVLPSFTEGFPQVLLEAMARGLPVVATRVGGVPRVVRDGENGLIVPPGDPRTLSAAIHRLLTDPSLFARFSSEGQRTARLYTRQVQTDGIVAFVDRCFPGSRFTTSSRVMPHPP